MQNLEELYNLIVISIQKQEFTIFHGMLRGEKNLLAEASWTSENSEKEWKIFLNVAKYLGVSMLYIQEGRIDSSLLDVEPIDFSKYKKFGKAVHEKIKEHNEKIINHKNKADQIAEIRIEYIYNNILHSFVIHADWFEEVLSLSDFDLEKLLEKTREEPSPDEKKATEKECEKILMNDEDFLDATTQSQRMAVARDLLLEDNIDIIELKDVTERAYARGRRHRKAKRRV